MTPRTLTPERLHRLDVQGFDSVNERVLVEVAPWLGLSFGGCALLAGIGTALASPTMLLILFPIAVVAALSPVHPFDFIYNLGIRHVTGTDKLPERGAPARFACGLGSIWLLVTAWAFYSGYSVLGYALGGSLSAVATLVATTDICIPSMIYRALFGPPQPRI